ncbi:hypothetical protein C8F01DRAFT_1249464, partial [Mycena amicta]
MTTISLLDLSRYPYFCHPHTPAVLRSAETPPQLISYLENASLDATSLPTAIHQAASSFAALADSFAKTEQIERYLMLVDTAGSASELTDVIRTAIARSQPALTRKLTYTLLAASTVDTFLLHHSDTAQPPAADVRPFFLIPEHTPLLKTLLTTRNLARKIHRLFAHKGAANTDDAANFLSLLAGKGQKAETLRASNLVNAVIAVRCILEGVLEFNDVDAVRKVIVNLQNRLGCNPLEFTLEERDLPKIAMPLAAALGFSFLSLVTDCDLIHKEYTTGVTCHELYAAGIQRLQPNRQGQTFRQHVQFKAETTVVRLVFGAAIGQFPVSDIVPRLAADADFCQNILTLTDLPLLDEPHHARLNHLPQKQVWETPLLSMPELVDPSAPTSGPVTEPTPIPTSTGPPHTTPDQSPSPPEMIPAPPERVKPPSPTRSPTPPEEEMDVDPPPVSLKIKVPARPKADNTPAIPPKRKRIPSSSESEDAAPGQSEPQPPLKKPRGDSTLPKPAKQPSTEKPTRRSTRHLSSAPPPPPPPPPAAPRPPVRKKAPRAAKILPSAGIRIDGLTFANPGHTFQSRGCTGTFAVFHSPPLLTDSNADRMLAAFKEGGGLSELGLPSCQRLLSELKTAEGNLADAIAQHADMIRTYEVRLEQQPTQTSEFEAANANLRTVVLERERIVAPLRYKIQELTRELDKIPREPSGSPVKMTLYAPNDAGDMTDNETYEWKPLTEEESMAMRDTLQNAPKGLDEHGQERPLHMLPASRSLDFLGDGTQSEAFVSSEAKFAELPPAKAAEIFENRSILLYNCKPTLFSFEQGLDHLRPLDAKVDLGDGYLPQSGSSGIVVDSLRRMIPDPAFRNGQPRLNSLQNLQPSHHELEIPHLSTLESNVRAVCQTKDTPDLPDRDIPRRDTRWAIAGNAGVKTDWHIDTGGHTYLK